MAVALHNPLHEATRLYQLPRPRLRSCTRTLISLSSPVRAIPVISNRAGIPGCVASPTLIPFTQISADGFTPASLSQTFWRGQTCGTTILRLYHAVPRYWV